MSAYWIPTQLNQLQDVNFTSLANAQFLQYNSSSSKFVNKTNLEVGGTPLVSAPFTAKASNNGVVWNVEPSDASSTVQSFRLTHNIVDNGNGTNNAVAILGWGIDPGGGRQIVGRPGIGDSWERSYLNLGSGGIVENHKLFIDLAGNQKRLQSYTVTLSSNNVDFYHTLSKFYLKKISDDSEFFTVTPDAGINCQNLDMYWRNSSGVIKAQIIVTDPNYQGYADFKGALAVGNLTSLGQSAGTIYTKSDPTGDIPFIRNTAIPGSGALNNAQTDFVWTTFNSIPGMYIRAMTAHGIGIVGYGATTPIFKFNAVDDYLHLGRSAGAVEVRLYPHSADILQIIAGGSGAGLKVGTKWEIDLDGNQFLYDYKISNGYTELTSPSTGYHALWLRTQSENTGYGQYFSVTRATNISAATGFPNGAFSFETEFSATTGKIFSFRNNGANIASGYHNGVVELNKLNVTGYTAATTPGSVTQKIPFYDNAGSLVGYIPVYGSIT